MSRKNAGARSPGRPRYPPGKRSRHFCVRVSDREWRNIVAHAEQAGESPSAFVRASTLGVIAAGGHLPVPATRAGAEQRRELRAIGVLLTQIDAYVNGDRDTALGRSLAELQRWIVSRVRRR